MSRRNFIKKSGIVAGGFIFGNEILQSFSTAPDEKLTIAIIGCGDRGKGIMHILKQLPNFYSVKGVCDILDFRLAEAKKVDAGDTLKEAKDYRQILDDKTIQAVVIATPLHRHYKIASDALAAGKHVFLEKTMTYSIPEAIELVKKAGQHPGQVLQVGHQYRYTPMCFKVKEMIGKNYLGDVTQIDCRWDRNWNWRRPIPAGYSDKQINWRMYKEFSGGLVAELLSHQMDFVNWAFNTHPDEIFATGGIDHFRDGRETYDNVQVMCRYQNAEMVGNFGATCGNARDGYLFKLKGTKGTVQMLMDDAVYYPEKETRKELETVDGVTGATKLEWNKEGGIQLVKEPQKDGTWYALRDFHGSIMKKNQPVSNVVTGATTAICVHLANDALYNHTIQQWKPAYNFTT
jgi:predicted dehydrogenase